MSLSDATRLANFASTVPSFGDINATGVVTARDGLDAIGIQSGGVNITTGIITALNFVGTGNTFAVNGTTVDISISAGAGGTDNINTGTAATFGANVSIADSIFHIGDDDTHFGFPAADTFVLSTGGVQRLNISQTVNITPEDNQVDAFSVKQGSNEYITVDTTNSSERVTIGNVTTNPEVVILSNTGIGTTNPNRLLHLQASSSTAYSGGSDTADYNFLKIENKTDDGSAGVFFQIGSNGEAAITATEASDGATDIAFQNRGSGVRSEKLRITSAGRLGINSTAPERRLDVLETASQTVAQFQTTGQIKALTRYECHGDNPVFVGASRSDFNIEMGGSNMLTIDHSTNDIDIAGSLKVNSGEGIDFSATGDGAGTDTSELLDDYEEGTWTPVIRGGTTAGTYETTGSLGSYTKIGRFIHCSCRLDLAGSVTGGGAGNLQVTGFPYDPASGGVFANNNGNMALAYMFGISISEQYVIFFMNSAATTATALGLDSSGNQTVEQVGIIQASDIVSFVMTYQTT